MGFFSNLGSKLSSAWSGIKSTVKTVANKAIDWVTEKVGTKTYDTHSVEDKINVQRAFAQFKSDIKVEAEKEEEESIILAMEKFDEFAEQLSFSFPELVDLVDMRRNETENLLRNTIIDSVEINTSESDPTLQGILKMSPGEEKKRKLKERMNAIIEEAQDAFDDKLKIQIQLLNDELNVRLTQKINAEEKKLEDTERKYKLLSEQQSSDSLDIQRVEEICVPAAAAAACIERILSQEDSNERMVNSRSGRSKRSRKANRAN